MISQFTLTKYLARIYTKQFILTSMVILFLLTVTGAFDILQKFKSSNISGGDFWRLIIYKIPFLYGEVSVLIGFISTLLFIRMLTKSHEMIVVVSSGIPIWKIFIIPLFITFIFGVVILFVVNPIGTNGLKRYENVESRITGSKKQKLIISPNGLYFTENNDAAKKIIRAKAINIKHKAFSDVTILFVNENNNFIKRIDSPRGVLKDGKMVLKKPKIITSEETTYQPEFILPVTLTMSGIIDSFKQPEMIHLWHLRSEIDQFAQSGISALKYQLYYYKQIFKPLSMMAMACIACWFVSMNLRDNSNSRVVVQGLIVGLSAYFFLQVTFRIVAHSGIAPAIATLLPILFIIIISSFVILHFQEA